MTLLTRWDPFRELTVLQDRMNRLFQDFAPRGEQELMAGNFVPAVDIYEDEQGITVKAELPGLDPKDVDVRVENNVLTIRGERKFEKEEKEENFHRIERRYGSFVRSFTLPTSVDTDNVKADYENGVLKIQLAKRAEAKPKQIKVNVGQKTIEAKSSGKAA
jgi:HSP20 family protein